MQPLTEPTFLILLSLASEARHGYGILQDVATMSDGRVMLSTGTLYTALKRLLDTGLIEEVAEFNAPRGRKAYQLTTTGRALIRAETNRISSLASLANSRLAQSS